MSAAARTTAAFVIPIGTRHTLLNLDERAALRTPLVHLLAELKQPDCGQDAALEV